MRRLLSHVSLAGGIFVGAVLWVTGCGASGNAVTAEAPAAAQRPQGEAALSNTDPCAMRMHDLAGRLLLYWFHRQQLPETLEQLAEVEGEPPLPPLVCPETGTAYLYNPGGIYLAERNIYVLVYDPTSAHAGWRWTITAAEPDEAGTLVAKVVAMPERVFAFR